MTVQGIRMTDLSQNNSDPIAVTMTREAADRFIDALGYGSAVIVRSAEANDAPRTKRRMEEHAEWLRWGASRVAAARRVER